MTGFRGLGGLGVQGCRRGATAFGKKLRTKPVENALLKKPEKNE